MRRPGMSDALAILVAVAILAGWIAYNAAVYDDWTCAFARCVKVDRVRP